MEANAPQERRHNLIAPAIAAGVLLGFIALCIAAFIPELDFADNLDDALPGDESPISTLPTVGKLGHFERAGPRHVSFWCGKVDIARLDRWKQQFSTRDHAVSYRVQKDDHESSWPSDLADYPAKLGLPEPFCEAGDAMFVASSTSGRRHTLRINVSKKAFLLECIPANDP
jgi:hypothetical protein